MTRTPLRISIGGGGTDLPSYYREHGGGFVISAAIDKYVYITINRSFMPGFFLKYSETEHVLTCDEIRHPAPRPCAVRNQRPCKILHLRMRPGFMGRGDGPHGGQLQRHVKLHLAR